MITLEYKLSGSGWADISIGNGDSEITFSFSYLHDSLKELASSAIKIRNDKSSVIHFNLEPEEYQLILQKTSTKEIQFELRKFSEWSDFNTTRTEFDLLLKGTCSVNNYINEIRNLLITIIEQYGIDNYNEEWKLSKFPIEEYELLK